MKQLTEQEIDRNKRVILALLGCVQRPGMENFIEWLQTTEFFIAPASHKYHLAIRGGLAQHSINVFNSFYTLCNSFGVTLSLDTKALTALTHDVCKHDQYFIDDGLYYYRYEKYSENSKHGARSIEILKRFIELSSKEEAMIRWHMGHYTDTEEFTKVMNNLSKEHPEAHLLYFADHIATLFIDDKV